MENNSNFLNHDEPHTPHRAYHFYWKQIHNVRIRGKKLISHETNFISMDIVIKLTDMYFGESRHRRLVIINICALNGIRLCARAMFAHGDIISFAGNQTEEKAEMAAKAWK